MDNPAAAAEPRCSESVGGAEESQAHQGTGQVQEALQQVRAARSALRDGGSQAARRASAPPPSGTGPIVRSSLCRGERVVHDREHLMAAIAIVCSIRSRAELSRETRARTRIEAGARRGGALSSWTKVVDQVPVWGDKRSCRDKARSVMESGATLVHYFCGSA